MAPRPRIAPPVESQVRDLERQLERVRMGIGPGASSGSFASIVAPMEGAERSTLWEQLGVHLGSGAPSTPITYSQWTGGATGTFMWIAIP